MTSTTPGTDPERHDENAAPVDDDRLGRDDVESAVDATPANRATGSGATGVAETDEPVAAEPVVVEQAPSDPARDGDASPPAPVIEPEGGSDDLAVTSRLDEAVERANADAAESDTDGIDDADVAATPRPVPADAVRRETYVPAATVATGTSAGAATLAEDSPEPLYVAPQPGPQTIYVQAPTPPKAKGNRGFGVLVALLGTVLFGVLYAGIAYVLYLSFGATAGEAIGIVEFIARPTFWVPVVVFFLAFALLAAIVNRGPWWAYAVFGLLVGVVVYFSYIGGALLAVEAWTLTLDRASEFIGERWLDPFAIIAAVVAREIPIWLGGWIAARGRAVTERNRLAFEAYDRELAAGPQPQRY